MFFLFLRRLQFLYDETLDSNVDDGEDESEKNISLPVSLGSCMNRVLYLNL
jgi:hypothetical protein